MAKFLNRLIAFVDKVSLWMIGVSALSIVLIMLDEVINAIGRKFGLPLPCALEAAVSLMIPTIFLAAPRVASLEEHTFVTMTTRRLPPAIKRSMDCFGYVAGCFVFGIVALGAWEIAYDSYLRMEMQIGVFRFPIWPFRVIFAFGMSLLSIQLLMNAIRAVAQILAREYPEDSISMV